MPLPHMIGSSPAMITATVIAIGRTRSAAPSTIPSTRSFLLLTRKTPRLSSSKTGTGSVELIGFALGALYYSEIDLHQTATVLVITTLACARHRHR